FLEEDGWGLATELQCHRDYLVGSSLVDDLAHLGGTGEGDLADTVRAGQCATCILTETIDDVEHTIWKEVSDDVHQVEDGRRGLLCGLHHDGITCGKCRGDLPSSHEDGEVPGDDLADNADGLIEMVGNGVVVD